MDVRLVGVMSHAAAGDWVAGGWSSYSFLMNSQVVSINLSRTP
jgi:hypothetical protein